MPTRRPAPPGRREPGAAALAAALGIALDDADRAAGCRTPADKILAVADRGGHWVAVTADGGKHRIAREAV